MARILLFTLLFVSFLFGEIIDRSHTINTSEFQHLSNIAESVQRVSGERIQVIVLNSEEAPSISRYTSSFATELKLQEERWILAVMTPSGRVDLSTSSVLDDYFSPVHLSSFSSGTSQIIKTGDLSRSIEFLLLNIADVISQKRSIDLGTLITLPPKEAEPKSFNGYILLILLLILISLLPLFRKQKQSTDQTYTSPLFGGTLLSSDRSLFGVTTKKRRKK